MKKTRIIAVLFVLLYLVFMPIRSSSFANELGVFPTIVLQVHEKGFTDDQGNVLKGVIRIPKESRVKIVFEYADIHDDEHEFALMLPSEEEVYSDLLSKKNKRVEISFMTGQEGERYEAYCIIDCEAMDNLVDLILMAA